MTFEDQANKALRKPSVRVILRLDYCANDYGVAPCTASLPAGEQCFNTRESCQDVPNFTPTTRDYIFYLEKEAPRPEENAFNCVTRVDLAPAKISPGKGLGSRNNVQIQFNDFVDDDFFTDPYAEDRNYIATDQGTFWGKFLARNPYYQGRALFVEYGFFNDAGTLESETYLYQIDQIKLDPKGRVTLTGKDPLSKTESFKNQLPEVSNITQSGMGTAGSELFFVSDADGFQFSPTLGFSGTAKVDNEIFDYTYLAAVGYQAFPRGIFGTDIEAHASGDLIQPCVKYFQESPDIVLFDLLTQFADIDPAFIDQAAWAAEVATWLDTITLTQCISEPAGVGDLIDRILKAINSELWYDPKAGQIEFKSNNPVLPTQYIPQRLTDDDFLLDSIKLKSQEKLRKSQIWVYTDPKDYLGDLDSADNYFNLSISADLTSEGELLYQESQVDRIFGDWLDTALMGQVIADQILNRYNRTPYELTAVLDAKDFEFTAGIHFLLDSRYLQGADGLPAITQFQVTSADYDPTNQQVKITALQFSDLGQPILYAIVNANGVPDYTLATDEQKTRAFVADSVTKKMSDGSPPYRVVP